MDRSAKRVGNAARRREFDALHDVDSAAGGADPRRADLRAAPRRAAISRPDRRARRSGLGGRRGAPLRVALHRRFAFVRRDLVSACDPHGVVRGRGGAGRQFLGL